MTLNNNINTSAFWDISEGWLQGAEHQKSTHFSLREPNQEISLLVVHNISLPPGQFGNNYITDLFLGKLSADAHPYFQDIHQLKVSAHCLIKRDGHIIQYVSFNDKAWHAGVSSFEGRDKCNDFSIGIELEGTDTQAYTSAQYQQLVVVTQKLQATYPLIRHNHIVGHNDIAPGRKTDPGEAFDWQYFMSKLKQQTT